MQNRLPNFNRLYFDIAYKNLWDFNLAAISFTFNWMNNFNLKLISK